MKLFLVCMTAIAVRETAEQQSDVRSISNSVTAGAILLSVLGPMSV